jgi:hypothetical protein
MIVFSALALAPLGFLVAALLCWSLYNAFARGRVRSHGWVYRVDEPKFFWFIVVAQLLFTPWFALIGLIVTGKLMGLF